VFVCDVCCQYFEMMDLWVVDMVDPVYTLCDGVFILDGIFNFLIIIIKTLYEFMTSNFVPDALHGVYININKLQLAIDNHLIVDRNDGLDKFMESYLRDVLFMINNYL